MKIVTDTDIKLLVIEALDYNAQVIAVCTAHFGNTGSKQRSKRFSDEIIRLTNESESQRKKILGITD